MNSTTRSRQNDTTLRRAGLAAILAVAGLLFGGCATTYTPAANLELFARSAPLPQLVPSGKQVEAAEATAARREGDFVLNGAGHSMLPVYLPGTAIVVHPCRFNELRRGQAVVYHNRRGSYVAHMLVEDMPKGWFAIGLNNPEPDDDLVTKHNLVGVITAAYAAADTPFRSDVAERIAVRDAVNGGARVAGLSTALMNTLPH
ncbi:MAG: S24/S26 family peptidase [Verrucomicrobia bacterium]|nr:S24/S26 family peptidase [Verrucomicrobiota bacterium]